MEATPGFCTMPWFNSIWFSEIRQIVTSAFRKSGFRAQRLRMTSELRSSADMLETSPAGAMVSAKSMTDGDLLAVGDAQAQVVIQDIEDASGLRGSPPLEKLVPWKLS